MDQIQNYIRRQGCSFALIFKTELPNPNFFYVTGFNGIGVVFIRPRAKPLLFVPEPEYRIAQKESKIQVINAGRKNILSIIKKKYPSSLHHAAIDKSSITVLQYSEIKKRIGFLKSTDISSFLTSCRRIKNDSELKLIKRACNISEKILKRLINRLHNIKTEAQAAAFLITESAKEGVRPSFDPIVASAPNSGKWHHTPTPANLKRGFIIIDFGVIYKGYSSDITRTVFKGIPKTSDRERYDLVSRTQKECIEMILPGEKLSKPQKYAEKRLGSAFCHSLGHGIGVAVHEEPYFTNSSIVKEGMTIAVEPGIYYPDKYGIRIEDDIVVTKDGPKLLTTPQNLIRI